MSKSQVKALLKKNFLQLQRHYFVTACDIFCPVFLILILFLIKAIVFQDRVIKMKVPNDIYFQNNTSWITFNQDSIGNLQKKYKFGKSSHLITRCSKVGLIIDNSDVSKAYEGYLKKYAKKNGMDIGLKHFKNIKELEGYITNENYGKGKDNEKLCFATTLKKLNENQYSYSLHYPSVILPFRQKGQFLVQKGPNHNAFDLWKSSGYLNNMAVINNLILNDLMNNTENQMNVAVSPQEYKPFTVNEFGNVLSTFLVIFLNLSFSLTLMIIILRISSDGESKAREGMRIMGLNEGSYFLSYLFFYMIYTSFKSLLNAIFLYFIMYKIDFLFIFTLYWLYSMVIFALAYFFQSISENKYIALVLGIVSMSLMINLSSLISENEIASVYKILLSIFPPIPLMYGLNIFINFQSSFKTFNTSNMLDQVNSYSILEMYLTLIFDFAFYIILGYYFENILSSRRGSKKPFYFPITEMINQIKRVESTELENRYLIVNSGNKITNTASTSFIDSEDKNHKKCLEIKNLSKIFEDGRIALSELNLQIYNDEIFVLLGENGSGKSTLISILTGLYQRTGGDICYENESIFNNLYKFRKRIGVCPEYDVLFEGLSVKEHLEIFSTFKSIDNKSKHISKILIDFDLEHVKGKLIKYLSIIEKKRLSIAIALIGDPEIVILDEPSNRLDIDSKKNFWKILKKHSNNRIILLTTNSIEEAYNLGQRIGIISKGSLNATGTYVNLINKYGKYLTITLEKDDNFIETEVVHWMKMNFKTEFEIENRAEEFLIKIHVKEYQKQNMKIFFQVLDANIDVLKIKNYSVSMPSLEDVFIELSERKNNKQSNNELKVVGYEKRILEIPETQNLNTSLVNQKSDSDNDSRFYIDLSAIIYKRLQIINRDSKSYLLEFIFPLIFVCIGLIIGKLHFYPNLPPTNINLNLYPSPQIITINSSPYIDSDIQLKDIFKNKINEIIDFVNVGKKQDINSIINFNNYLSQNIDVSQKIGAFYPLEISKENKTYDSLMFINLNNYDGSEVFLQYYYNNMINAVTNKSNFIEFKNSPFPLTISEKSSLDEIQSLTIIFFLLIGFSLMPMNFITFIIRERESNSKQLQIMSGISVARYWINNYIFDFIKFAISGGFCFILIFLIASFSEYDKYNLGFLYLIYGLSVIPFTYLTSFFFKKESKAQFFTIALNIFMAVILPLILFILCIYVDSLKVISYILLVFPQFSFGYGIYYLIEKNNISAFNQMNTYNFGYLGSNVFALILSGFVSISMITLFELYANHGENFRNSFNNNEARTIIEKLSEKSENNKKVTTISVENLIERKVDNSKKESINHEGVSISLNKGDCFAILGLNGAGKTTVFQCLVEKFSADKKADSENIIGYCPQSTTIVDYLTVEENLYFYASIKGIPKKEIPQVIEKLMKDTKLIEYKEKVCQNLSIGNKRKILVSIALLGNPSILLLDEPTNGMDAAARKNIWSLIHKTSILAKESTVIITTNSVEDAQSVCNKIGIMAKGEFKCIGTSSSIKRKFDYGYEINLRIETNLIDYSDTRTIETKSILDYLKEEKKDQFFNLIQQDNLGSNIWWEANEKGFISINRLQDWINNTHSILSICKFLYTLFPDMYIVEYYDNIFKLKIKKNEKKSLSIGYIFGLFEEMKDHLNIAEYSISQSDLEHIFQSFNEENEPLKISKIIIKIDEKLMSIVD